MNVLVRQYEEYDADKISNIIRRNLFEVNIKDYGEEEIRKQAEKFKSEDIIRKFKTRITYVATYMEKNYKTLVLIERIRTKIRI